MCQSPSVDHKVLSLIQDMEDANEFNLGEITCTGAKETTLLAIKLKEKIISSLKRSDYDEKIFESFDFCLKQGNESIHCKGGSNYNNSSSWNSVTKLFFRQFLTLNQDLKDLPLDFTIHSGDKDYCGISGLGAPTVTRDQLTKVCGQKIICTMGPTAYGGHEKSGFDKCHPIYQNLKDNVNQGIEEYRRCLEELKIYNPCKVKFSSTNKPFLVGNQVFMNQLMHQSDSYLGKIMGEVKNKKKQTINKLFQDYLKQQGLNTTKKTYSGIKGNCNDILDKLDPILNRCNTSEMLCAGEVGTLSPFVPNPHSQSCFKSGSNGMGNVSIQAVGCISDDKNNIIKFAMNYGTNLTNLSQESTPQSQDLNDIRRPLHKDGLFSLLLKPTGYMGIEGVLKNLGVAPKPEVTIKKIQKMVARGIIVDQKKCQIFCNNILRYTLSRPEAIKSLRACQDIANQECQKLIQKN